jgi:hypothetical protein
MNQLSPFGWFLFILIAIGAFFVAILPVTANFAFFLMGCGMDENAVPVAFVISAVAIIGAIIKGAMS